MPLAAYQLLPLGVVQGLTFRRQLPTHLVVFPEEVQAAHPVVPGRFITGPKHVYTLLYFHSEVPSILLLNLLKVVNVDLSSWFRQTLVQVVGQEVVNYDEVAALEAYKQVAGLLLQVPLHLRGLSDHPRLHIRKLAAAAHDNNQTHSSHTKQPSTITHSLVGQALP